MDAFKLIVYPYAGAIAVLCISIVLATVAFGYEPAQWLAWQNKLVTMSGTIAGIGGGSRRIMAGNSKCKRT